MSERKWPGRVARILNEFTVVVNRGHEDGVTLDARYLVYALTGEDVIDPEDGTSLGKLEVAKGTGTVTHIQERMATIRSDRFTKAITFAQIAIGPPQTRRRMRFDAPAVGDRVKPI